MTGNKEWRKEFTGKKFLMSECLTLFSKRSFLFKKRIWTVVLAFNNHYPKSMTHDGSLLEPL